MKSLADSLRRARELYLARAHMLGPQLVDQISLVQEACTGDAELVLAAWELLDQCAPGGSFATYADGGKVTGEGDIVSVTYAYDRRPSEVAAIIGKACVLAEAMPEPRKQRFAPPPPTAPVPNVAVAAIRSMARDAGYVQDPEEERDDG